MSKSKTAIKLNIQLNGENKTIAFNLEEKFSEFLPLIQSSFKTNVTNYDIYISKEMITNYNKTIKEIIGRFKSTLRSTKERK